MLTSQDLLNITLSLGFIVLVGFISYAAYQLALTLKALRYVAQDLEDTANGVRMGALSLVRALFGRR